MRVPTGILRHDGLQEDWKGRCRFLGLEESILATDPVTIIALSDHELWREINLRIDLQTECQRPLSHDHLKPVSQISQICPDAASCASGDAVLVFAPPSPYRVISVNK